MHPDHRAQCSAIGAIHFGPSYAGAALGAGNHVSSITVAEGLKVSALEQIAQRIHGMAESLGNSNYNTGAFIERVAGPKPSKPEPSPATGSGGDMRPALVTLNALLDRLEYQVFEAGELSRDLKGIA